MALTIEQIQENITNGGDVRQIINQIADYIQANPGGGSGDGGSSFLVYTALLSQSGTDAPVATELENTLGGTVIWTRDSTGVYTGTLNGAFTENKTFLPNPNTDWNSAAAWELRMGWLSANAVQLYSFNDGAGTPSDSGSPIYVEIRVYP